jgi:hypothetical protein
MFGSVFHAQSEREWIGMGLLRLASGQGARGIRNALALGFNGPRSLPRPPAGPAEVGRDARTGQSWKIRRPCLGDRAKRPSTIVERCNHAAPITALRFRTGSCHRRQFRPFHAKRTQAALVHRALLYSLN